MKIVNIKIEELKEYNKNPRKNNEAVKYVANSIKEFEELIKQKITDKTKTIWFPEKKKEKLKDVAYE